MRVPGKWQSLFEESFPDLMGNINFHRQKTQYDKLKEIYI